MFAATTPNLACLYNRIFLLLGWPLANYHSSLRYAVGNPFLVNTAGDFGFCPDHKSVFTYGELSRLLRIYGLDIVASRGFSYAQKEQAVLVNKKYIYPPAAALRQKLGKILPKSLSEGMLFLCKLSNQTDYAQIKGGILQGSIWSTAPKRKAQL